jgi:hypothetical protein
MKNFLLYLSLILCPLSAIGNGGSFETSVVQRTGNLVPLQKEKIFLDSEQLDLRIEENDVFVKVEYMLHNKGPEDAVMFGFPVDLVAPESAGTPNSYEYVLSKSLNNFLVADNGQELPVTKTIEEKLSRAERPPGIDPDRVIIRKWSLVPITFKKDEKKRLTVSYQVRCMARDEGFEGHTFWKYSLRAFFYTFRPAATWGDKRVKNLVINLDASWLIRQSLPVPQVSPQAPLDDSGRENWTFSDQDLSEFADMTIHYEVSDFFRHRDITRNLLPPDCVKKLTASSTLRNQGSHSFDIRMLRDNNRATAWVEGTKGGGEGETLTFQPKNAYVTEIGIQNGYTESEELYYANSRVKKLRVAVEFEKSDDPEVKPQLFDVELPDRPYREQKLKYPYSSADWILENPEGFGFMKSVTLTILEVYPGTRFSDTAISELYVCGFRARNE